MDDLRPCAACGSTGWWELLPPSFQRVQKFCSYQCSVDFRNWGVPAGKPCTICGAAMHRRDNEDASSWRRRQTCSKDCRYVFISRRVSEVQPAYVPPPKTCEVCGRLFEKRRQESHVTFDGKKACSRKCAGVLISHAQRETFPAKTCIACGSTFERRNEEPAGNYHRRMTCSWECFGTAVSMARTAGKGRMRPYPTAWNKYVKEAIRERDSFACQECGVIETDRAHHVHHIDFVKSNLEPNNLVTLCPSCHSKTCNHANKVYFIERYQAMMAARFEDEERAA